MFVRLENEALKSNCVLLRKLEKLQAFFTVTARQVHRKVYLPREKRGYGTGEIA